MHRLDHHRPHLAVRLLVLLAFAWAVPASAQDVPIRQLLPSIVVVGTVDGEFNLLGSGSGTIVSPTGLIITNYHVIGSVETGRLYHPDGFTPIFRTMRSDQPAQLWAIAQVVEGNPETDLAVLQIVADERSRPVDPSRLSLPAVPLGDSDGVEVGDRITILGFPGVGNRESSTDVNDRYFVTLTDGTVSGFEREGPARSWIRTSAPIMGGNSGGAALDRNGCLIGVPTASRVIQDRVEQMALHRPINYVPATWLAGAPLNYCQRGTTPSNAGPSASASSQSSGVTFSGQIVDANTGRGIAGAVIAFIRPSWNPDSEIREEDLESMAETDAAGNFYLAQPVTRGQTYTVLIVAEGYRPLVESVEIDHSMPPHIGFGSSIRLQR